MCGATATGETAKRTHAEHSTSMRRENNSATEALQSYGGAKTRRTGL